MAKFMKIADQWSTGGVALRHLHARELKPPDSGTVADVAAASLVAAVAARRTARALQQVPARWLGRHLAAA